jgi:hypothetical protein
LKSKYIQDIQKELDYHRTHFQFFSQEQLHFSQPRFKFRLVVQRALREGDVGLEELNGRVALAAKASAPLNPARTSA